MKKLFAFFLLFLIIPISSALDFTATVDIMNSPVKVELLTTDLKNNILTVSAKISDANGYEDIEKVEVKIMFGDEVYSDYQEAVIDSNSRAEALYTYTLQMAPEDKQGVYTVKVKASDSETTAELETAFNFPEERGLLAGAFTQSPDKGPGLLTRFFKWLGGFFS